MTEVKMAKKADRLRARDLAAKTDRYIIYGYSQKDAELLAQAELESEDSKHEDTEEK